MKQRKVNKFSGGTKSQNSRLIAALKLQQLGKTAEAEAIYRQILRGAPTDKIALYSLAVILLNSGRLEETLHITTAGTTSNPDFAPLWFVHASVFQELHRIDEALACYDRAITLDPKYTEALVNSGVLLFTSRNNHASLRRFQDILAIDPDHEKALGNYGGVLSVLRRGREAVEIFERLIRKNPDYPYGLGFLFWERMRQCDWTDFEKISRQITEGNHKGKKVFMPHGYMALSDSPRDHYLFARTYAEDRHPSRPDPLWRGEHYNHDRIRIAYVSPDFGEHPVGHLMAGVFEAHDKSRFEISAISIGVDDGSRNRARIIAAFDNFIDAKDMHPRQIAEIMRQMEVDIAVDLAGYTRDAKPEIFQNRPAPIQVNYLGFPGTMALDCYDYILADRTVITEEDYAYYTEKVAYLDHCYLPVASGVEVAEPLARSSYGLPETGFVFCAFSHDYKIHPEMFAVWMKLLECNPGSVLWLMSREEESQKNLWQSAQNQGIDPNRLVFATRVPNIEDHLARYRVAQLFLDTWPYNAHTTAADALLAGLPVVTCKGNAFPSRVAASLLETLGFKQLVTSSFDEYFELANSLAREPERLRSLNNSLLSAKLQDHPFIGASFTRSIEKVFANLLIPGLNCTSSSKVLSEENLKATPIITKSPAPRRLHIGGKIQAEGWEVLNANPAPYVDHVCNAMDLSRFEKGLFSEIYASHVVEHFDYIDELLSTLKEWLRVLEPGGKLSISVPDLDILAKLFISKESLSLDERFAVMRMIFGGHVDRYDYHVVGLNEEILSDFLRRAGYINIKRVDAFDYFHDTSSLSFKGVPISLNIVAEKPVLPDTASVPSPPPPIAQPAENQTGSKVNIALNKPARQSSMSPWSRPNEASDCVNGLKTGSFSFHTNIEVNPWWQVDLEDVYLLTEIVVYNRDSSVSSLGNRAKSMAAFISSDGFHWENIYNGGESFGGLMDNRPLTISCPGRKARLVRLQLQEENYLHLDEVEVFTEQSPAYDVSLSSIARKYDVGKLFNEYFNNIGLLFSATRKRVTKVLEIGVSPPEGLLMWRDWFSKAAIHNVDQIAGKNKAEGGEKFLREVAAGEHPRIVLHDQGLKQRDDLLRFAKGCLLGSFDLILDSSYGEACDRQRALGTLFSLVKPGGYYIINNLHDPQNPGSVPAQENNDGTFRVIENALAGQGWHSKYMLKQEISFLNAVIDISQSRIMSSGGVHTCIIRRRAASSGVSNPIVQGKVAIVNYATFDHLNQSRQQHNIEWAQNWGAVACSTPGSKVTSTDIVCFGPDSLDSDFAARNAAILNQPRGGGYWLWKPYIVAAMLAATNAEFVVYCDCGSTIIKPLALAVEEMRAAGAAVMAFDLTACGWYEQQWTKGQVIRAMGATDPAIAESGQLAGTAAIFRVCDESRSLVNEWLTLMQNPAFTTDVPSNDGGDPPGFKEHRHDQSVFSLLVKTAMVKSGTERPIAILKDFRSWVGHHAIS